MKIFTALTILSLWSTFAADAQTRFIDRLEPQTTSRWDVARSNAQNGLAHVSRHPKIDGSQREAFSSDVDSRAVDFSAGLQNIPIGEYTAQFSLVAADGKRRGLRCSKVFGGQFGNSVDLFWDSNPDAPEVRGEQKIYVVE